jgi:hypothetical protein
LRNVKRENFKVAHLLKETDNLNSTINWEFKRERCLKRETSDVNRQNFKMALLIKETDNFFKHQLGI